uniref:Uncharacterized protein n=1 Tax=Bos mutus grunniens TaxID=30521 RepID=A0A8B9Y5F7_BOSMU
MTCGYTSTILFLFFPFVASTSYSFFSFFFQNFIFFNSFFHVAVSHFSVTLLQTFELGPTLFWCSEEATFSQPFSHSTIYLAVSGTSLKCFIKARLFENCKKSLSFLITPMHASPKLNFTF